MPKRKKAPRKRAKTDRFPLIEAALSELKKAELTGLLIRLAKDSPEVHRDLESKLEIEKPIDLLLADIVSAIERATNSDDRMLNRNFEVDWEACEEVKEGS